MKARPAFICIDSCDGGGSTTQRDRLVATLTSRGVKVWSTEQPSKGPIGTWLRGQLRTPNGVDAVDPTALQMAFTADRAHHLARVVEPARDSGCVVVCDRGELSTVFYSMAGGPVETENQRARIAMRWHDDFAIPTLTISLAVPAEIAAERRRLRRGPTELFDAAAFQARVAGMYQDAHHIVRMNEECRYTSGESFAGVMGLAVIDGTGTIDEVAARVLACVDSRIDLTGSTQG